MQPGSSAHAKRRWQRLLLVLAVIIAALLVLGVWARGALGSPEFHATAYEPPAPAANFALADHTGGTTSLEDLRGTPVLLFFGYTRCPDVCPLTLSALRAALDAAGAAPGDARILLVTVDPHRDDATVLAAYVRNFGPDVLGLTGSVAEIESVLADYGIHAGAHHADPSLLGHTSAVYGIDRSGMIRVLLRPDAPPAELRADVATLLKL